MPLAKSEPPGSPRSTAPPPSDIEVNGKRFAVSMWLPESAFLVRGRSRAELPEKSVLLENEGDYPLWADGVDHTRRAEEDSVVVTVRWPSIES